MAKKEQKIEEQIDNTPRLSPKDYWEWRCTISEMQKGEVSLKLSLAEAQILRKDAEIAAMKIQLHNKGPVQNAKDSLQSLKDEYNKMKGRLEENLGFSLNGKMIDEFTYEIKDIPQTEEKE